VVNHIACDFDGFHVLLVCTLYVAILKKQLGLVETVETLIGALHFNTTLHLKFSSIEDQDGFDTVKLE